MKGAKYSSLVFVLSVLVIAAIRLFVADSANSLSWDVFGYYLYLPAYFIYDDLTLQNFDWVRGIIDTYNTTATFYQGVQVESGNWVMRYPAGLALLNIPGFILADFLAEPLGFVRDGFSKPYQLTWIITGLFYAFMGLFFSIKVLLQFFSDRITAVIVLLLVFGTNYLWLATYGNPLSHGYLFALYAVAFYLTLSLSRRYTAKGIVVLGVLIGLITMCRPNEGLFLLLALIWLFGPPNTMGSYWPYLKSKIIPAVLLGMGVLIGGLPQLIYWKLVSGHWFFYSYQDNGVGFDLLSPHTLDFLFSYRKGWFLYTPIMALATLGFILLFKKNRQVFYPIFFFFLVNLYVVSSWSVWWYAGGSYSSRSMVSTYPLMAIPLGYLLQWLHSKGKAVWISSLALFSVLMVLNLFQFWQYKQGIIDGERMTKAYYWQVFGKTTVSDEDRKLLLVERPVEAYESIPQDGKGLSHAVFYQSDLGKEQANRLEVQLNDSLKQWVCVLDAEHPYTAAFETPYGSLTNKEYAWLRISAEVFIPANSVEEAPMLVVQFNHKEKAYKYSTTEPQGPKLRRGEWQSVQLDYMTPEVRSKNDKLKVYLWYRGTTPVYARKIRIEKFEPTN